MPTNTKRLDFFNALDPAEQARIRSEVTKAGAGGEAFKNWLNSGAVHPLQSGVINRITGYGGAYYTPAHVDLGAPDAKATRETLFSRPGSGVRWTGDTDEQVRQRWENRDVVPTTTTTTETKDDSIAKREPEVIVDRGLGPGGYTNNATGRTATPRDNLSHAGDLARANFFAGLPTTQGDRRALEQSLSTPGQGQQMFQNIFGSYGNPNYQPPQAQSIYDTFRLPSGWGFNPNVPGTIPGGGWLPGPGGTAIPRIPGGGRTIPQQPIVDSTGNIILDRENPEESQGPNIQASQGPTFTGRIATPRESTQSAYTPQWWNNLPPEQQNQLTTEIVKQGVGGGHFKAWLGGGSPDPRINQIIEDVLSGRSVQPGYKKPPKGAQTPVVDGSQGPGGGGFVPGGLNLFGPTQQQQQVNPLLQNVHQGASGPIDLSRADYFTGAQRGLENLRGIAELQELAQTGGVTDQQRDLLRTRTNAPISSAYEGLVRRREGARDRGGFSVPGYDTAADFQGNRDLLSAIGQTNLDAELALADLTGSRRLQAAGNLGALDLGRTQQLADIGRDRSGILESAANRNQQDRQFLAQLGLQGALGFDQLRNQRLGQGVNLFGTQGGRDLTNLQAGLGFSGLRLDEVLGNRRLDVLQDANPDFWDKILPLAGAGLLGWLT